MGSPSRSFREHFLHPWRPALLEGAEARGEAENTACGDWVCFQLRLAGGRIEAASVQVRGCSATIACASLTGESLAGLALADARALDVSALATAAGATRKDLSHAPSVVERSLHAALAGAGLDCQASMDA